MKRALTELGLLPMLETLCTTANNPVMHLQLVPNHLLRGLNSVHSYRLAHNHSLSRVSGLGGRFALPFFELVRTMTCWSKQ